jgi:hypothetical protein
MGNLTGAIDKVSNPINHFIKKPQYLPGIKQPLKKELIPCPSFRAIVFTRISP